ncbi:hypothetical protein EDD64_12630 [Effusibacillus lacus]|nr:hypothetical protein EDD64_12630 [Effusibacillus lacus]
MLKMGLYSSGTGFFALVREYNFSKVTSISATKGVHQGKRLVNA